MESEGSYLILLYSNYFYPYPYPYLHYLSAPTATTLNHLESYLHIISIDTVVNMAPQTGLDVLRTRTVVDCDTLDEQGTIRPNNT